jgi:uncharacterized membrane protein YphA (DoxX/SURF4 family)
MGKCLSDCCDKPAVAQCLTRLGVGALFLIPGIEKFMDPAMFQGILGSLFGWTGLLLTIGFWGVVALEILGGLFVITGPFIPKILYKLSLLGLFIIMFVALFSVAIPLGNKMELLFHVLSLLVILSLFLTQPICPFCPAGKCKK